MKKSIAILVLILGTTFAWALDFDPFKGPKPVAVLVQTNPWLMVIGSDTPMVVIYDDGQVIYLIRKKEKYSPLHTQVTSVKLAGIKKKLSSLGDYSKLMRFYNLAPNVTDLPVTNIYLDLDGKKWAVSTRYTFPSESVWAKAFSQEE